MSTNICQQRVKKKAQWIWRQVVCNVKHYIEYCILYWAMILGWQKKIRPKQSSLHYFQPLILEVIHRAAGSSDILNQTQSRLEFCFVQFSYADWLDCLAFIRAALWLRLIHKSLSAVQAKACTSVSSLQSCQASCSHTHTFPIGPSRQCPKPNKDKRGVVCSGVLLAAHCRALVSKAQPHVFGCCRWSKACWFIFQTQHARCALAQVCLFWLTWSTLLLYDKAHLWFICLYSICRVPECHL